MRRQGRSWYRNRRTRHMISGSYPRKFLISIGERVRKKRARGKSGRTPNGGFCRNGGTDKSFRKVLLISSDGNQKISMSLSSRSYSYKNDSRYKNDTWYQRSLAKDLRDHKRYRDLLSRGWQVIATWDYIYDPKDPYKKDWKKFTQEVDGSTRMGDQTHGDEHNSGEVAHKAEKKTLEQREPSLEKESLDDNSESSTKPKRGRRGGRGNRQKAHKKETLQRHSEKSSNSPVYSYQPIQVNKKLKESVKASAKLIKELVGKSIHTCESSYDIDIEGLMVAIEIGEDPTPYLEIPEQKPRMRILVTPDCSGSCQDWSGVAQGWALELQSIPGIEVFYVENCNGEMLCNKETKEDLIKKQDIIIYLGDGDNDQIRDLSKTGCTIISINNVCSSYSGVQVAQFEKYPKGGVYIELYKVHASNPDDWTEAIKLAIKKLF